MQFLHPSYLHRKLLTIAPTEAQEAFYKDFEWACGYSGQALDSRQMESLLISALALTYSGEKKEPSPVLFILRSPELKPLVIEGLRSILKRALRGRDKPELRAFLGARIEALRLGVVNLESPPTFDRWISFGFFKTNSTAYWLRTKLVE